MGYLGHIHCLSEIHSLQGILCFSSLNLATLDPSEELKMKQIKEVAAE